MKKILLILFGAFCALTAQAQLALSWWGNEANGGDKMFEAYLSTLGLDKDNDGKLSSDESSNSSASGRSRSRTSLEITGAGTVLTRKSSSPAMSSQ